jgi:hypothetical protein
MARRWRGDGAAKERPKGGQRAQEGRTGGGGGGGAADGEAGYIPGEFFLQLVHVSDSGSLVSS